MSDLKYAFRLFLKSPAFTTAAILSLAIGIGANTAIFSVANALLLRPLPYADADRLAILWNRSPGLNIDEDWFSTAQYFDIKNATPASSSWRSRIGANFNLTGGGEPERVGVIRVSSNLLPMLGARPALGQLFAPKTIAPGARRRRRSSATASGRGASAATRRSSARRSSSTARAIEIVGVLPEAFSLPREVLPTLGVAEDGEIFLPLPLPPNAPRPCARARTTTSSAS